ncbi:hypothetical protein LJR296_003349 [Cupriavidus necator]|uniref:hypothetical protein n=1 Tax=Cupriavidus necator TaxID=106590 RepID=UPI003ED15CF0
MDNAGKAGADGERSDAPFTDGELIQRLRLRAADCRQKSMTARLAAVIDEVEALLLRGYDRSQVRNVLLDAGWHFTSDSFDSALTRVRTRRSADGSRASRAGTESALSGDSPARGNHEAHTPFSDIFVGQDHSLSRRRWK